MHYAEGAAALSPVAKPAGTDCGPKDDFERFPWEGGASPALTPEVSAEQVSVDASVETGGGMTGHIGASTDAEGGQAVQAGVSMENGGIEGSLQRGADGRLSGSADLTAGDTTAGIRAGPGEAGASFKTALPGGGEGSPKLTVGGKAGIVHQIGVPEKLGAGRYSVDVTYGGEIGASFGGKGGELSGSLEFGHATKRITRYVFPSLAEARKFEQSKASEELRSARTLDNVATWRVGESLTEVVTNSAGVGASYRGGAAMGSARLDVGGSSKREYTVTKVGREPTLEYRVRILDQDKLGGSLGNLGGGAGLARSEEDTNEITYRIGPDAPKGVMRLVREGAFLPFALPGVKEVKWVKKTEQRNTVSESLLVVSAQQTEVESDEVIRKATTETNVERCASDTVNPMAEDFESSTPCARQEDRTRETRKRTGGSGEGATSPLARSYEAMRTLDIATDENGRVDTAVLEETKKYGEHEYSKVSDLNPTDLEDFLRQYGRAREGTEEMMKSGSVKTARALEEMHRTLVAANLVEAKTPHQYSAVATSMRVGAVLQFIREGGPAAKEWLEAKVRKEDFGIQLKGDAILTGKEWLEDFEARWRNIEETLGAGRPWEALGLVDPLKADLEYRLKRLREDGAKDYEELGKAELESEIQRTAARLSGLEDLRKQAEAAAQKAGAFMMPPQGRQERSLYGDRRR
jgi:hypothetical protein